MKEWGVRVVPLFMLWKNGEKIAEWSGEAGRVERTSRRLCRRKDIVVISHVKPVIIVQRGKS